MHKTIKNTQEETMMFNEDKLQEEIIKTWGEFGVHNEVFKAMTLQIKELKEQLALTDVVSSCDKQKEQLLKDLWYKRNPCHDNDQEGNDRFWGTALCVFEDYKLALTLPDVSQQRELLEGFVDWFNANDKTQAILSERIEEYLKTL